MPAYCGDDSPEGRSPNSRAEAYFFSNTGWRSAGLIVLIAAGLLHLGIQKRRNRRLEEEIRFLSPCVLLISTSINPA